MSLTDKDKKIIVETWALVRVNPIEVGIQLFQRFFEANPTYVAYFSFAELCSLQEILQDTRLKVHAGRVMQQLSSIVDNLNNPERFEQHLQEITDVHAKKNLELDHFENLKKCLLQLLVDKLGPERMNDEAQTAWSKAYDAIMQAFEKSKAAAN